jgi:transcriptional regulator with XRE-family HTH domain
MNQAGQKIRALRLERNWSQADFAARLEISIPAVSNIETGASEITLSRTEQIALVFGMTIADLLAVSAVDLHPRFSELAGIKERLWSREAEVCMLKQKIVQLYQELRDERLLDCSSFK